MPTLIRERPIESTTTPVTIGGKNFLNGLMKNPKTPSNIPPISVAPNIALYATTPPPIDATTLLETPIKPELVPITIGNLPPTGPIPIT